jgi:hypothetical protein
MENSLTTASILSVFSQTITAHGGTVSDIFNDGKRLFVRSTLPQVGDAQPKDRLQGGVALKACDGSVWVHPYVFRLVCKNGAIMASAITSRQVSAMFDFDPEYVVSQIQQVISDCCAPEVFNTSLNEIRSAREIEADMAINMLPFLTRIPRGFQAGFATQIMKRFFESRDRSRFGLMNAVTSVARDTKDPEMRWNLEELGGGIPVLAPAKVPQRPARAATRQREEMLV